MELYEGAEADIKEGIESLPPDTQDALARINNVRVLIYEAAQFHAQQDGREMLISRDISRVFENLRQGPTAVAPIDTKQ